MPPNIISHPLSTTFFSRDSADPKFILAGGPSCAEMTVIDRKKNAVATVVDELHGGVLGMATETGGTKVAIACGNRTIRIVEVVPFKNGGAFSYDEETEVCEGEVDSDSDEPVVAPRRRGVSKGSESLGAASVTKGGSPQKVDSSNVVTSATAPSLLPAIQKQKKAPGDGTSLSAQKQMNEVQQLPSLTKPESSVASVSSVDIEPTQTV